MTVPSANEFRKMVKRAPGEPNLGDGTDAVPLMTEHKTIDISVAMGVSAPGTVLTLGPLVKADDFTVTNLKDGSPYAGGICIKGTRLSESLDLRDGAGKFLARIFKIKGHLGSHASYEICSPHKFHPHQRATPNTGPDGKSLYTWAKVNGDNFGDLQLKVNMFSHKHGGEYIEAYHSTPHLPEGGYMALKGPPPISFIKSDGSYVAFLTRDKKGENTLKGPYGPFKVHIAPGMDPCLIICFVAILEEYEKKKGAKHF